MQHRVRIATRWLLVVVWMFIIFLLSNESADGSSVRSDAIVGTLQSLGMSGSAELLSVIIRKIAHVTAYAVLGALIVWAFSVHRRVTRRLILLSIIVAGVYAISDEIHQAFIPGRSAEVRDVLFDTIGAMIGASLAGWAIIRRQDRFTTGPKAAKVIE